MINKHSNNNHKDFPIPYSFDMNFEFNSVFPQLNSSKYVWQFILQVDVLSVPLN